TWTLSLYSSEIPIDGSSVNGPRWAGGARSPTSSRGYAAIGAIGVGTGVGTVEGAPVVGVGCCSVVAPGRGGSCPPTEGAASSPTTMPMTAPAPIRWNRASMHLSWRRGPVQRRLLTLTGSTEHRL